ncbi:MAG: FAD-dependent oxidoreductase [bacterium]
MGASSQVERHTRPRPTGREPLGVVVVGAGVSGCACAAALASKGARVTALNSALDAVGLPGYGPDLPAGAGGWAEIGETMASLPVALRGAWLNAASVPENGAPLLIVDRRAVSIETKRALERIPGLQFRQGLVTDIRVVPAESQLSRDPARGRLEVETVFGEVIEADAVVVAVGLGLGGHVTVGADVLPGGRYGEIPADGLRKALGAMGVTFREVTMEVGARFSSHSCALPEALAGSRSGHVARATVPVRGILEESGGKWPVGRRSELERVRQVLWRDHDSDDIDGSADVETDPGNPWPEGYPPAAHWTEGLRIDEVVLDERVHGATVPLLSPDGVATAELHLSPEGAHITGLQIEGPGGSSVDGRIPASRRGYTVHALVVTGLDPGGRLAVDSHTRPRIWVTGRAAGADGYLESLRSGARVAEEVARELAEGGSRSPGGCFGGAGGEARDQEDRATRATGLPGVDGEPG